MNLFDECSAEEIELSRKLYELGGACVYAEWTDMPRTQRRVRHWPTPPFAHVLKHNPDSPGNIPRAMKLKIRKRPLTMVYVAWPDEIWAQVRRYFEGRETTGSAVETRQAGGGTG